MTEYFLDTNVFIDCYKRFPPDIFVSLWERLKDNILDNRFIVMKEILLEMQSDEIPSWFRNNSLQVYYLDDYSQDTSSALSQVIQRAGSSLPEGADPIMIAGALESKLEGKDVVVVSNERRRKQQNPTAKKKVPDLCDDWGIKHLEMYAFMREMEFKF